MTLAQGRAGGLAAAALTPDPAHGGQALPAGRAGDRPVLRRGLTSEDRAVIAVRLRRRAQGEQITLAQIGELIDRDTSVVSREIARNSGPDGSYHGALAHAAARERRRRPKEFRLVANPRLCRQIEAWMDHGWSPKLIATIRRSCPGR